MKQSGAPKIVAAAALIALTLLFFWQILLTNLILVGVDTFLYFYPYKAYAAEALRQGRLPLWNPHLFMGAPLLANSQVGLFYPLNWPLIWLAAPKQVAWSIGLHIALAGLLMLTYGRLSLGLGWRGALVAAIIFAFGGYLGAQVEHINQLNAATWLPLIFLLYDLALRPNSSEGRPCPRRLWFWLLALAVVVALTLLAGHAQTVFISLFGLGLYALWRGFSEAGAFSLGSLVRGRDLRPVGRSLLAHLWPLAAVSLLAVALAAIQLLPTAELSALSIRSSGLTYREVVSFSLRPTALHYALLPPLGLDLSQILGEAFGEWVAYLGVTGLVLALLGMVTSIWQPRARQFAFLAASGLVLSLGMFSGPLYLVLYYLVPGFDLFRVPARWLLLYAFGGSVLAGIGFEALLSPSILRSQLAAVRRWLGARWWRRLAFVGLPVIGLAGLIGWKTPPVVTLVAWLVVGTISLGLIYYQLRSITSLRQATLASFTLIVILLAELFWAAQGLNYNQPTAPHAYDSMRNAVAFLLAADHPPADDTGGPPGRFLSLSGVTYDPGDLDDLKQIFEDSLSPKALHKLIVATKEKEVLFFNLPLLYGLHSVDGYDGGILPLAQFVTLQELFLPPDELSRDGRLREKLRFVPPGRLLSLFNTRWIITDKQFDVWIDGIFYDLQFPAQLTSGKSVATADIPTFPATALGVVSHLDGAGSVPDGTVVAYLTLSLADGSQQTLDIRAGLDTAEGHYPAGAAHQQATVGVAWPYQAAGVDYIAVYPLATPQAITGISLTATLPETEARFVLRGLSLIHQPTQTSRSILLTTEGAYRQVHSGDVKIYENLAVLPRAYLVHRADIVPDEAVAIAALKAPHFDPIETFVRLPFDNEAMGSVTRGHGSPADGVTITSYRPEQVELVARLGTPGWLVLTDANYPGWQATVNGQPAEIIPANLMFRAIPLPAGEHLVQFEFRPGSLRLGAIITGLAWLVLAAGLAFTGLKR
jgi:hypothetical protein